MRLIVLIGAILFLTASALFADSVSVTPEGVVDQVTTMDTSTAAGSAAIEYPPTPERRALLESYARFTNWWRFVEILLGFAVLILILFTGLSARFRDWARAGKQNFLQLWIYFAILMIVMTILDLPFTIYRDFVVENQYGFMNQTFGAWFGEQMLSLLIGLILGIIPVWLLYAIINRVKQWWLVFSLAAIPLVVLFIVVTPVFISPLFNDFQPMKDKVLEEKILGLASKAGIEGSDVFEVNASKQSSKINAYVTGLFNTKRIVLYDNLINSFTHEEIGFVMGHEMGHYVLNHIWKGVGAALVITILMLFLINKTIHRFIARYHRRLGFDRLGDYASLPLILLFMSVISFFLEPVTNGLSRYHEHESDVYGMDITGIDGETAATAFDKLSVFNLSDPDPHPLIEFWFYSHPALKKRMEFVRSYRPGTEIAKRE